jgi:tetratricopeptide (TPR) repeat protein
VSESRIGESLAVASRVIVRWQWLLFGLALVLGYSRMEGAARLNAGNACLINALARGTSFERCRAQLKRLTDELPDQGRAQIHLGIIYFHDGEFERALGEFGSFTDDAVGGLYAGLSEEALGRTDRAISEWQKAGAGLYYYSHGEVARHLGKLDSAAHLYERALSIDPGSEATRLAVAEVYATLADHQKVEEILDGTVTTARGHALVGIARYRRLQMASARESLLRALKIEPGNYEARWFLGMIYWYWERWEDALREFNALMSPPEIAKEGRGQPYWAAGAMNEKLGETETALATYLRGIRSDPAFHPNYLGAGRSYAQTGQQAESVIIFRSFLRLDPGNAAVLQALAAVGSLPLR